MLQPYLHQYAESVDVGNYQVQLQKNLQYEANKAYEDQGYFGAPWFMDVWRQCFRMKLKSSGIRISSQTRVLDACCGAGYLGEFLKEEYLAQVVYCDISQAQLRELTGRLNRKLSAPAAVSAADLLRMPFQKQSFDLVVGNSFLHHVPDVPRALSELKELIRPGGYLLLLHEPSVTSAFWESFPLSLLKNTTLVNGGFTDLWMFLARDLYELAVSAGFTSVKILGTGILSSILLNWYLILAMKLNWQSKRGVFPAYRLREWLNQVDSSVQNSWKLRASPSLMLIAKS